MRMAVSDFSDINDFDSALFIQGSIPTRSVGLGVEANVANVDIV